VFKKIFCLKTYFICSSSTYSTLTYYLHDASGNTLATYQSYLDGSTRKLKHQEHVLYGSSRLGTTGRYNNTELSSAQNPGLSSNHLHSATSGFTLKALSEGSIVWIKGNQVTVTLNNTTFESGGGTVAGDVLTLDPNEWSVLDLANNNGEIVVNGAAQFMLSEAGGLAFTSTSAALHITPLQSVRHLGPIKQYELSNHLGNVITTVASAKIWEEFTYNYTFFNYDYLNIAEVDPLDHWTLENQTTHTPSNGTLCPEYIPDYGNGGKESGI